jgi:hypothetical protein
MLLIVILSLYTQIVHVFLLSPTNIYWRVNEILDSMTKGAVVLLHVDFNSQIVLSQINLK